MSNRKQSHLYDLYRRREGLWAWIEILSVFGVLFAFVGALVFAFNGIPLLAVVSGILVPVVDRLRRSAGARADYWFARSKKEAAFYQSETPTCDE